MDRLQRIPRSERGSAMLTALCLSMVFALCLTSFVELSYTSLLASSRNFMSSRCAEIAEMGIEEALYCQNYVNSNNSVGSWTPDGWTFANGNASVTMTLTSSGLVNSGGSTAPTPLNLGNGATATVNITVYNYANSSPPTTSPYITSQCVIAFPNGVGGTNEISRTVSAGSATSPLTAAPLFVNAIAATGGTATLATSSPSRTIDSYNSTSGAYSAATSTYSAVVSSTSQVSLNNATVHGYVVAPISGSGTGTPPYANVQYQATAKVQGVNTPATTSVDTNQIIENPLPHQPLFSETTAGFSATTIASIYGNRTLGTAGTTTYYSTPIVSLQAPFLTLNIQGNVILVVTGSSISPTSFSIGQGATLQINANSSLQIMLESGGMSLASSAFWGGGVSNANASPKASQFVILAGNNSGGATSSISLTLLQDCYGAIYAPNQAVSVSDSGHAFYGSIVGQSVSITNTSIHYDTALRVPAVASSNMAFQNILAPAVAVSSIQESVP